VKKEIEEKDIQGGKYVKRFLSVIGKIRSVAESEPRDPRRELDIEQLAGHLLFFYYTPVVTSLRAIQHASELKKVQRLLDASRAALGSLSEA